VRAWLAAAIAILAFAPLACREQPPVPETSRTAAPAAKPAGASGLEGAAEAGAFCKEHGVLEAVCTKCNPALIAVFKARGDWCAEHEFPESICPICHPDRGGRPAVDVSPDEAPADGTKVMFKTRETARLAGLRTVAATEGKGGSHVLVTARIVYDAAKVARVNARAAGVIQAVRVDVGARVRAGAPLAVIESAGVGADQSRLQAARSQVQVAEANHTRVRKLREDGIVSEMDVLAARRELDEAQADLDAARTALGMVGGTKEGISRYTLSAPIGGVVTARGATIGRLVDTEEVLFEIVDTSTMWAEVDIAETEVSRIATGQRVTLTVDGMDGREFSGTLTYIAPEIDSHTRTATGRISLANPDGALRANMFAHALIEIAGPKRSVLVPREAVQRARGTQLVFVRLDEKVYEARRVVSGPADGNLVAVVGRVSPGDRVVTDGSFLLKTETLKGSIGAGCCDVEKAR
jgi:cobalt-zinc-cadmium efflux system membrane fusion protein